MRVDDIRYLMEHLYKYAYKWKEIGISLGFHHGELENISHTFPRSDPQRLLTEMLNQWAQWPTASHRNNPTLEALCDTLRSGPVGLGAAASDLDELRNHLF